MSLTQHLINHVALVIDESTSMRSHKEAVISVFDAQVAQLVELSQEKNQETRISVYLFSDLHRIRNIFCDIDVLRVPSLKGLYEPDGWTALLDAVILSQEDLAKTFTKYGDHAFVTYVITDGIENRSRYGAPARFARILATQDDRWTLAALVPDQYGKQQAIQYGFPAGNVAVWDVNSATGFVDAGKAMRAATETFMTQRTAGVTKSETLFAGSAQQVNAATVAAAGLKALDPDKFFLFVAAATGEMRVAIPKKTITKARPDGIRHVEIKAMVESTGRTYVLGNAYYELVKSEKVTANKMLAVVERGTSKVYVGRAARDLIGLGDTDRRIRPMPADASGTPPFKIFVQSQSTNRLLPHGSQVLLLK